MHRPYHKPSDLKRRNPTRDYRAGSPGGSRGRWKLIILLAAVAGVLLGIWLHIEWPFLAPKGLVE